MNANGGFKEMIEVDTLIAGGRLLLMDEADTVIREGAVAVDKGRIAAAGPYAEILARFRGRNRIDAPRSLILPGLVNAHTKNPLPKRRQPSPGGQ